MGRGSLCVANSLLRGAQGAARTPAFKSAHHHRGYFSKPVHQSPHFSSHSLGLYTPLVLPHLDAITSLPEVSRALEDSSSSSSQEGLERAAQIFESMDPGGTFHVAVLAMLADGYQQGGKYSECINILHKLESSSVSVKPGLVKALWYSGDFERAASVSRDLVESDSSQISSTTGKMTLGLSQLMLTKDRAGQSEASELFREVATTVENDPLTVATAYCNLGVTEALAWTQSESESFHAETAMDAFNSALSLIEDLKSAEAQLTKNRLHCNIAWTSLQASDSSDDILRVASDSSKNALSVAETTEGREKQGLIARALTMVAGCYIRAGSAVTAEGLLQTAVDTSYIDPLSMISKRNALETYASLCRQWEKREVDGEKLQNQADRLDSQLPASWQGRSAIYSGLIFPFVS